MENSLLVIMICLNIFLVIICIFISIFAFFKIQSLKKVKLSLKETEMYNKTLELLYDDLRSFKHDFFNIIQSIDGYIKSKDINSLEKYYDGIKKDCDDLNTKSILSPQIIDDSGIYNLITSKYYKAKNVGISFDMHILSKISSLEINPYILSRILGVLMDNAIEAACDSIEKKIIFEIVPTYNRIKITLMNSYANKNVDLDQIYEKGITSKKDNITSHGIGLWKINKILERYDNLKLRSSKSNDYFIQTLEIFASP